MKMNYDKDLLAHRVWEVLRAHLKNPGDVQDAFGELTSRFLSALLAGDTDWPARRYWFDGVEIDEHGARTPHGFALKGRAHFAQGEDKWFTAPVEAEYHAPPDGQLSYRVVFDATEIGEGLFEMTGP